MSYDEERDSHCSCCRAWEEREADMISKLPSSAETASAIRRVREGFAGCYNDEAEACARTLAQALECLLPDLAERLQ